MEDNCPLVSFMLTEKIQLVRNHRSSQLEFPRDLGLPSVSDSGS